MSAPKKEDPQKHEIEHRGQYWSRKPLFHMLGTQACHPKNCHKIQVLEKAELAAVRVKKNVGNVLVFQKRYPLD